MEAKDLLKRGMLWCITPEQLMQLFDWKKHQHVVLPILPEEIRGATIVAIREDFVCRCFMIQVCREDWPEVLPGQELARIGPFAMEQEVVDIPPSLQDHGAIQAEFVRMAQRALGDMVTHPKPMELREQLDLWYRGYLNGGGQVMGSMFINQLYREFICAARIATGMDEGPPAGSSADEEAGTQPPA
jgi:hypothetical protein